MEQKICQSCGMPMMEIKDFGTNADNSPNEDYCTYCFTNGKFAKDFTMDEMILLNVEYLDEFNKDSDHKYTREEAIAAMKEYFPTLKRWKK